MNTGAPGTVRQYSVGPDGTLTPKSPPAVAAEMNPAGIAISGDGGSVYVANASSNSISQYAVGSDGSLSPRSPAAVAAGRGPLLIAVTPLAHLPTSKDQCKNGGWRNFPQFKNQGSCVSFVETQH
jgi:DNA-binding beta-propeller fold protein YncE